MICREKRSLMSVLERYFYIPFQFGTPKLCKLLWRQYSRAHLGLAKVHLHCNYLDWSKEETTCFEAYVIFSSNDRIFLKGNKSFHVNCFKTFFTNILSICWYIQVKCDLIDYKKNSIDLNFLWYLFCYLVMFSHQWTFFCSQSVIKFLERLTNPFQCISIVVHRYFFVYVNYGSEGGIEEII